jgi:hypothetical protein
MGVVHHDGVEESVGLSRQELETDAKQKVLRHQQDSNLRSQREIDF